MARPTDLLAVLVDGDNVAPSMIGAVLTEVARLGTATVKRVYGDWSQSNLVGWKAAASEHVLQPMQQFANTRGKNATDIALIIDAMDLLYTGRFQGFCIVSSDGDFTRLASRIREQGLTVYGFGERKTPESLRNACDEFTYLDVLTAPEAEDVAPAPKRVPAPQLRNDPKLVNGLRACATTASGEDGWANLATVGSLMRKQQPDFDSRNWGYAKFSDLVRATELFQIESREGGGMQVRSKK
ncbi:NYN domain-containing protein [Agrococcus sp. KRD186]|uniref:NYN domain-containing protein n=1 Tax=Agrococcus sp. KRD186 TaxID=2729730 RepID=UPI0019D0AB20|nr:NYN domain-containing protein [Agrococcus sp. KRD186]